MKTSILSLCILYEDVINTNNIGNCLKLSLNIVTLFFSVGNTSNNNYYRLRCEASCLGLIYKRDVCEMGLECYINCAIIMFVINVYWQDLCNISNHFLHHNKAWYMYVISTFLEKIIIMFLKSETINFRVNFLQKPVNKIEGQTC